MNSHGIEDQSAGSGISRQTLFQNLRAAFRAADIDTADLDARILVCAAAGISLEEFVARPDEPVGQQGKICVDGFQVRRLQGEPVARILGVQEFWSQDFALSEATLVPRPETEFIVEAAVTWPYLSQLNSPRIADIGTGSGCILISILKELPNAHGCGVDISQSAIRMARQNAESNGVGDRTEFFCGSWLEPVVGKYDLVVSNPPYIPSKEIDTLDKGVAGYEPRAALDGGEDGLDAYRAIGAGIGAILSPGARLIVEIGLGQTQRVIAIMKSHGLVPISRDGVRHDLAGIERIVVFQIAGN